MPRNWSAVEWDDGRLSEVRKSDLLNCNPDELITIGKKVEVLVKEKSGNRTYTGTIKAVGSKAEMVTFVNSQIPSPNKQPLPKKRVSKKSKRYDSDFDSEELEDDDEVDPDFPKHSEQEIKKTTKAGTSKMSEKVQICSQKTVSRAEQSRSQKRAKRDDVLDEVVKSSVKKMKKAGTAKTSKKVQNCSQKTASKAEQIRSQQRAAIRAQQIQAKEMLESRAKIMTSPVTSPVNTVEEDLTVDHDFDFVPERDNISEDGQESSEEMEIVEIKGRDLQEREDLQLQIKQLLQKLGM